MAALSFAAAAIQLTFALQLQWSRRASVSADVAMTGEAGFAITTAVATRITETTLALSQRRPTASATSVTAGAAVVAGPVPLSAQQRISFADGRVSFVPPPGFTPLTSEEMLVKFNRGGPAPKAAVGNASRSVTIAFGLTGQQVPANDLVKVQQVITDAYNGAGFVARWIKNEIVELGGMRWVFFDVVTRAADTEVHNQALFGVLDGQLMAFNFNATMAEFSKVEGAMAKARQSIRVVNPPTP